MEDIYKSQREKITKEKVEDLLKSYRYVCWRISLLEEMLSEETNQIGVDSGSIEFLEKVFFQNEDIKALTEISYDLGWMYVVKDTVDFALKYLRNYPDNGDEMHNVINSLYICDNAGHRITFECAFNRHKLWIESHDGSTSRGTFKNRRNDAIALLQPIIQRRIETKYFSSNMHTSGLPIHS